MAEYIEDEENDPSSIDDYKELFSMMQTQIEDQTFGNFCGSKETVERLKEYVVLPLKFPQLFQGSSLLRFSKLLLFGAPGCGKSYLLRAAANEAQVKLFVFNAWNLQNRIVGGAEQAERCIDAAFNIVRDNHPCILCLDDLEVFSKDERHFQVGRTALINQLHNKEKNDKVVVVGTTQRPWEVDAYLRRLFIVRLGSHLPDKAARVLLLKKLIDVKTFEHNLKDGDFEKIAEKTEDFTGADIHCLVRSAVNAVLRELMNATHFKKIKFKRPLRTQPDAPSNSPSGPSEDTDASGNHQAHGLKSPDPPLPSFPESHVEDTDDRDTVEKDNYDIDTVERDTDEKDKDERETDERDTYDRETDDKDTDERDIDERHSIERDTDKRDTVVKDTDERDTIEKDTDEKDTDERDTEDRETDEKFTPCRAEEIGAIAMSVMDILDVADEKLHIEYNITLQSLEQELAKTRSTVSKEELAKLNTFEETFC